MLVVLTASPALAAVSVVIAPGTASLPANGAQPFTAKVFGSANQNVRWEVNGVPGGAPSIGVISDSGVYTAPPDAPELLSVTVEAEPVAAPASPGTAKVSVAAGTKSGPAFYLSPTGDDSHSGTKTEPWATFKHALKTVPAGARILVEGDTNHPYHELVTIDRSGSPTAGFLSIEAAPGAHPAIDGTGLPIFNQEDALITISNASWVRVKGLELRNYFSNNKDEPIGIYFTGAGDHIEILNNQIHAIKTTLTTQAADAIGILVEGTAKASVNWVTIDGNELFDLELGQSESLSLSGNVELWQVTNNFIHDNNNIGINIEGFFGTDTVDPALDQARRGLIADNVVHNISSFTNKTYGNHQLGADALYVDGGTLVTLQDNLISNSDYGIELASETPGKTTSWVWAHDNIVHASLLSGITIGGSDAHSNGGTTDCFIANNTFYLDDTTRSGEGEFQVQNHATRNVVVDNIFFAGEQDLQGGKGNKGLLLTIVQKGPPGTFDHNLYFGVAQPAELAWGWEGKLHVGFAAFQAASGQDKHGKVANPDFVSAVNDNFKIPPTSPAVALGEIVSLSNNGLVDYAGKPRILSGTIDAGALQH